MGKKAEPTTQHVCFIKKHVANTKQIEPETLHVATQQMIDTRVLKQTILTLLENTLSVFQMTSMFIS